MSVKRPPRIPDVKLRASEKETFATYLPQEIKKALRLVAVESGRTIHEIVTDALSQYLTSYYEKRKQTDV